MLIEIHSLMEDPHDVHYPIEPPIEQDVRTHTQFEIADANLIAGSVPPGVGGGVFDRLLYCPDIALRLTRPPAVFGIGPDVLQIPLRSGDRT